MIMRTEVLGRWVDALLTPELEHIRSIRFGTKALSYQPSRFTNECEGDPLMQLFSRCVEAGRHVAVMAHFSHPRELSTAVMRRALRRITTTGAIVRAQAPVIAHVNDDAATWVCMWQRLVELGVIPYYMFVERDTGAHNYFEVPLVRALGIYSDAVHRVSGLARSARGPVMSTHEGKIVIDGAPKIMGTKVFALRMLQARNPHDTGRQFFAHYDQTACWWDGLRPALGTTFPTRSSALT